MQRQGQARLGWQAQGLPGECRQGLVPYVDAQHQRAVQAGRFGEGGAECRGHRSSQEDPSQVVTDLLEQGIEPGATVAAQQDGVVRVGTVPRLFQLPPPLLQRGIEGVRRLLHCLWPAQQVDRMAIDL
jgi:hypothetical protein